MTKKKAIVIGAGIVGLATARKLALKGYQVDVFDRNAKAKGASVRNFGMIWPIGQPAGKMYERAMRSRSIWLEVIKQARLWHDPAGSLHLAHRPEEMAVIEEFVDLNPQYQVLKPGQVKSEAVVKEGLRGALYSDEELIIDPVRALSAIANLLQEQHGVTFHWRHAVSEVDYPAIKVGTQTFQADLIYVCNGADFEHLYPEHFAQAEITKCKLQMMRIASQPDCWQLGSALCGGLTLVHYESFKSTPSHAALKKYYQGMHSDYLRYGLNVMVSQNSVGELTVGDSHEYGFNLSPFNEMEINQMILEYLYSFARFKSHIISEYWNGTYAKMTNGATELVLTPQQGVTIVNGPGGAGMTLSFGLMDELLD